MAFWLLEVGPLGSWEFTPKCLESRVNIGVDEHRAASHKRGGNAPSQLPSVEWCVL